MSKPDVEIETTYLATALPAGLTKFPATEIIDRYLPVNATHPVLRLRAQDGRYTLTKKLPVSGTDSSIMHEFNTSLSKSEYDALSQVPAKCVSKVRYRVPHGELTAEVDVFSGDLAGLVIVDMEFGSASQRDATPKPAYCGVDVTQDALTAGGMLAGKSYADIADRLAELGYHKIVIT